MTDPEQFYNDLASSYDIMTSFDTRIVTERRALAPIVDRYAIRRAVDMGCGSGVQSLALAGLGVEVFGVDLSTRMLEQAQRNADELGLKAHFCEGDMRTVQPVEHGSCDAVLCLGNTLPHLEDSEELQATLVSWKQLLRPGGVLLLQTVNYDRVLRDRERVLGIRKTGNGYIVRFYDFTSPRIGFNVLEIQERDGSTGQRMITTALRPFGKDELLRAVDAAGFRESSACAGLEGADWSIDSAAVLVTALR